MTDDGEEVKAGGRVVKNVAGYDLMKLHIGVARHARRHHAGDAQGEAAAGGVAAVVVRLHAGRRSGRARPAARLEARPVAVELLNAAAWRAARSWHRRLPTPGSSPSGFEEKAATRRTGRSRRSRDELAAAPVTRRHRVPRLRSGLWSALTELQLTPGVAVHLEGERAAGQGRGLS